MNKDLNYWNDFFEKLSNKKIKYDYWLDKYKDILNTSKNIPIIDLGCGSGNDTLYLIERGYKVISCDYSIQALSYINENIIGADTRLFNMLSGLPFKDKSTNIIIADLSIHYFCLKDTIKVVNEIFRVLKSEGYLLCRLNSTKDTNYGSNTGNLIEENFYENNGMYKRFFDEKQIKSLFGDYNIKVMKETEMSRYEHTKIVWEVVVENK